MALSQGRYTYRHNAVLRQFAHELLQEINKINNNREKMKKAQQTISFVREGQTAGKAKKSRHGILLEAKDWVVDVDLKKQLKFPQDICDTDLRPDMLLKSQTEKTLILIELTSPCEENLEVRHREKEARYEALAGECRKGGWKTFVFAVEVGARGYVSDSFITCLRRLGIQTRSVKRITTAASNSALRCSFWIWLRKSDMSWSVGRSEENDNNETLPAGESSPSQQLVENVVMIQEDLPQNPIQDTSRMVRKLRNEAEERNPRSPGEKII